MKKIFLFLIALVATCYVPISSWAAEITFKVMYNNEQVTSVPGGSYIYVYKDGKQLNNGGGYDGGSTSLYGGTRTITLDDSYVGETVSYRSSMGHEGKVTVTDGMVINLNCQKLTVTTKDKEGNPLTYQYVNISGPNSCNISAQIQDSGTGILYLAPADGYTYSWNDGNDTQSGYFDMTSDYNLNLIRSEGGSTPATYSFSVIAKYGDFPVDKSTFYLTKYGDTSSYGTYIYSSSYGSSNQVAVGDYWLRDDMGAYSKKIEVRGNTIAYVDYQKVTFISKTGTSPNANQTITVSYKGKTYSGNSNSVTTNSKGEAAMYLLPGEYAYTVAGNSTNFTVGEEDGVVNINTSKVTISLSCDDISALNTQTFEWGAMSSSYSEVIPEDGKIVINTMPGNYKLRINRVSEVDVTVTAGENIVPVQLFYVMFTTNLSTGSSTMYLGSRSSSNSQSVGFDTKYYLTSGEYWYGTSSYSQTNSFTLDGNKTIALNYATLTVNVKDTDGNAVADQYVYCTGGNSMSTDMNGQASWTLLRGTYTVYVSGFESLSQTVELNGDKSVTLTIPAYVTFNVLVNGQPMPGYSSGSSLSLYSDRNDRYSSIPVYVQNGVGKARVEPGKAYYVSSYHGSAVITEGCTLSLGTLSISCEGMGLAFPMENWDAVSTYDVVVGSTVRLTAIPVTDDKFQHWTINGNDYNSPVIDLKLTQPNTTAKAVFGGTITSAAKAMLSGLTFDIDDNYIYLGDDKEGTAKIYTSDGKLVKSIGVIGGQIGIYDLSTGVYILSFQDESGVKSTRFSKK